jgi:hypothetical protein
VVTKKRLAAHGEMNNNIKGDETSVTGRQTTQKEPRF